MRAGGAWCLRLVFECVVVRCSPHRQWQHDLGQAFLEKKKWTNNVSKKTKNDGFIVSPSWGPFGRQQVSAQLAQSLVTQACVVANLAPHTMGLHNKTSTKVDKGFRPIVKTGYT